MHEPSHSCPLPAPSLAPLTPHFIWRKRDILAQLAVPEAEYADASPKGFVDAGIRDLIAEVNAREGLVTTSSCAGRVSVFLEGSRRVSPGSGEKAGSGGDDDGDSSESRTASTTAAGVGGKGGGGAWLFVSHDPVPLDRMGRDGDELMALLGMGGSEASGDKGGIEVREADGELRLIHFKFEPMILHILTASPEHAQDVLRCGLQAGFRESGAISLTAPAGEAAASPMVAIRSMGLGLESLIGAQKDGKRTCTVSGEYLWTLIDVANERFAENQRRIERFRQALRGLGQPRRNKQGDVWEDPAARRERKRAEGLLRSADMKKQQQGYEEAEDHQDAPDS